MKNPIQLSPKDMINAYLLFFVVHGAQVGVGIQGFQRIIYQDARQDAWISVLLAGIASHIVTFCMIKTLEIWKMDWQFLKCYVCLLLFYCIFLCFTKLY